MEQINAAGGIRHSNGPVVKFAAKSYDFESTKDRVQQRCARLFARDKVMFLINPCSSIQAEEAARDVSPAWSMDGTTIAFWQTAPAASKFT